MKKKTAYTVWQSEHAEWREKNMATLTSQFNVVCSQQEISRVVCAIFFSLKLKNRHLQEERQKNIFSDKYLFVWIVNTEVRNWLLVINFQPVQVHWVPLVLPWPSYSTMFSVLWQGPIICLSFHFRVHKNGRILKTANYYFYFLKIFFNPRSSLLAEIR